MIHLVLLFQQLALINLTAVVAKALMENTDSVDEITLLNKVSELTGVAIPKSLDSLDKKKTLL